MPERVEKLKAIVKELETELATLGAVDTESQAVLEEAIEDLRVALGKADPQSLESETLIARLRTAEEDFHVSHPTVSGLVLRMIDALGQLGI